MKKMMALGGAACVAALAFTTGPAMATQPDDTATFPGMSEYLLVDGHKVTYCHRTGSAKNPYVVVTSDIKSVNGPTDHQHHEQVGNGEGPDIIPISELVKKEYLKLVPLELCVEEPEEPEEPTS